MKGSEIWIGLVEIRPLAAGLLGNGTIGAFVNTLAKVRTEEEFIERTTTLFKILEFEVVAAEDVEPLAKRLKSWIVADELTALAELVRADGITRYGAFQSFKVDDEDDS
jgi:hypothetical protein